MDRNILSKTIDDWLKPIGLKKSGSSWTSATEELNKFVKLQKSKFSNLFYIDYGYIINSIPLAGAKSHIYERVGSVDHLLDLEIQSALDLENDLTDDKRISIFNNLIMPILVEDLEMVRNEKDVFDFLKKRDHLNDISLSVKKHFGFL